MGKRHRRARKRRKQRENDSLTLELPQARSAIRNLNESPLVHIAAANTLCKNASDDSAVSIEDLLECIRRGHIAAELGAYALNLRLGRRTEETITPEDNIVDLEFWLRFIDVLGEPDTR